MHSRLCSWARVKGDHEKSARHKARSIVCFFYDIFLHQVDKISAGPLLGKATLESTTVPWDALVPTPGSSWERAGGTGPQSATGAFTRSSPGRSGPVPELPGAKEPRDAPWK